MLPTQFGKHFWPPFSQVLGIRVDYLSPAFYLTDFLILVLFISWLKRKNLKKLLITILTRKIIWLAFFAYLSLNILFSNNPLLGLYGFIKILELLFLGCYVAGNIKSKKELATIAVIFSFAVIAESLLAIVQYIHQGSINGFLYFLGERKFTAATPGIANASINGELILRPYATFPHPNVLAGFLLCSLIIIYSWFEDQNNIMKKFLKTTSLLLGSVALFLTLSRIAIVLWVLLVIAISVKKIIKQKSQKTPFLIPGFLSLILAICISLFIFTPVLPRLQNTRLTEESIAQRLQLLQSTFTIILSRPLFGVGLNNFIPSLSHVQKPLSPTLYLQPVHNIFLLTTAELGVIGTAFFLFFIFQTYMHAKNSSINKRLFLVILLSAILILGLFDHYWLTLQQGQLLFALILGLCWAF